MAGKIPKKTTLRAISKSLRAFDFSDFNPAKDKVILMIEIQKMNAKLGKLLRELEK